MGLKRRVSDEETSPVKLRKDAEAAVSVLSPFSSPGQFKRKLSKYSMVVSPNVIGYASDVIVSMADKPTKSVYQALEQTLNSSHSPSTELTGEHFDPNRTQSRPVEIEQLSTGLPAPEQLPQPPEGSTQQTLCHTLQSKPTPDAVGEGPAVPS